MGGASSFYAMLAICGFLTAAWSATKISKLIGISSIVLEITTGVVLGPRVLGLIDNEYAQCEHQRHSVCEPPTDLYERIAKGEPLGATMGRIANMDYCDLHGYLEKEGRLDLLHGHTGDHPDPGSHGSHDPHGSGNLTSDPGDHGDHGNHRDPCGDGAHLTGLYMWTVSLGNGSYARYYCRNGKMIGEDKPTVEPIQQGDDGTTTVRVPSTIAATTTSAATSQTTAVASATTGLSVTAPPAVPAAPAVPTAPAAATSTTSRAETTTAAPVKTTSTATTSEAVILQAATGEDPWDLLNVTDDDEANATVEDSDQPVVVVAGTSASGSSGGSGRRLSGGGGGIKYDTYSQCLEKSCEADVSHHCSLTPDVFTLIGHAGVALMIFESGMHFDFEKARQVGLPACVVAVIGTILPLVSGALVVLAFGKPLLPDGISAGTALAPTSVGISLRLLGEAGVLQENFGQAIITAAFVDDILSLVLFNVLFSLGGDFNVMTTVVFPVIGIAFMLVAMYAAVKFWPWVIERQVMTLVPDERDELATGLGRIRLTKDEVLFLGMMALLVVYALITHLLGTHLWGCFMAGMSFACLQPAGHAHHVWVKQTKRMTTWMVRIFFACTVAFSIPVADLMSFNSFWKGTIMGIGPCILTKVSCAFFMGPPRFVIGWAMVGRAEFAYLIAQMAAAANMIDEETFSICIWALLYATIFAPFVFRYKLNNYLKQYPLTGKVADAEAAVEDHSGSHGEEKRGSKRDFASADGRLDDLECIKFPPGSDEDFHGRNPPDCEVMQHSADGADDEANPYEMPAKSFLKPRGGVKVPKGQQGGIFPGGGRGNNGYLCCLFFRRIIEH